METLRHTSGEYFGHEPLIDFCSVEADKLSGRYR